MNREEEILQSKCYVWFHNAYPGLRKMLFHVDNNSWNRIIGAKKKALGVNAGVSDLIFISQGCVTFLEAKTESGKQTPEQKEFMNKVTERGHEYIIFRTFEQFKIIIYARTRDTLGVC
jgi:hypothetical protein